MAVVKAPALSLDASGNLGAICYSSWRGLNVARGVWTGTDPNTAKQQAMRAKTKAVVKAWGGTLTEAEREAWRAAALSERRMSRVKTVYTPTGYQFYVQLNIQRKRLGSAIMTLPPAAIVPYTWTEVVSSYDNLLFQVDLKFLKELNAGAANVSAEVWRAGPFDSGGRHAINGEYRFLKFIKPIVQSTDIPAVLNKYYWYKARVMDDYGRAQNWFEDQVLAT